MPMSTVLTSEITALDRKLFIFQEIRLNIIYITFIICHLVQLGVCVFFFQCINIHNLNLPVSIFGLLLHVVSDIFHNCLSVLCTIHSAICHSFKLLLF